MTRMLLVAMSLTAGCLALLGCDERSPSKSSEATKSPPSAPVAKVPVSGQAFIVTKGRQNIKLALVEVIAIPEKDVLEHIKAKRAEGREKQALLLPQVERAKKEAGSASSALARAEKDAEKARQDRHEATMATIRNRGNVIGQMKADTEAFSKEMDENLRLQKAANSKGGTLRELGRQYAHYDSPAYYADNLPNAVAHSKTDADGNFSLSVPPGKYAIAAATSRAVFKDTEQYYWIVWVDVKSPIQGLMLSNDNLLGTGCRECVSLPRDDTQAAQNAASK